VLVTAARRNPRLLSTPNGERCDVNSRWSCAWTRSSSDDDADLLTRKWSTRGGVDDDYRWAWSDGDACRRSERSGTPPDVVRADDVTHGAWWTQCWWGPGSYFTFYFYFKTGPTTQRTTKFKCGHTVDWTFDCLIDVEAQKWRWGPRRYSRSQQFGAKRTTRSVPHHRPFQLWRHQAAGRGVRLIGYVVQRTIAVPVLMACPVQSRPVLIWQSQSLFLMRLTELLIWMHVCSNRLTVNFNFNDIITVLFCYVRGTMRMVPGERWPLFSKCAEQTSTRVYFNTLFLCEDTGNAKTLSRDGQGHIYVVMFYYRVRTTVSSKYMSNCTQQYFFLCLTC